MNPKGAYWHGPNEYVEIESLYTDSDFEAVDLKLVIYDNCEFYFKQIIDKHKLLCYNGLKS